MDDEVCLIALGLIFLYVSILLVILAINPNLVFK